MWGVVFLSDQDARVEIQCCVITVLDQADPPRYTSKLDCWNVWGEGILAGQDANLLSNILLLWTIMLEQNCMALY